MNFRIFHKKFVPISHPKVSWKKEKPKERKEKMIKRILENKYKLPKYHDKIPDNSCYKHRPDFVWDNINNITILEIDEKQHKTYECQCDQARMVNVTQDFGGIPVIWIRFNPDNYIDYNKEKHRPNINNRMEILIDILKKCEKLKPKTLCSIVYLYYDNFDKKEINIEEISFESLGL